MTLDLDTMARSASADLRRRTESVDTEAALAALHRSAGSGRHRARRLLPSGRTLAVAAAATVVLLAALAFVAGTRGGDGTERLGTEPSQPIDPTSYGPLLGTLHGVDDPALTAEVYGPAELQDGSPVAVSITGGRPGQRYVLTQCATGASDYNPAADCNGWADLTVGPDGSVLAEVQAWAVFAGGSVPYVNDCRAVRCSMEISPLVEEDQPDEGLPGTVFAPTEGTGVPASVPMVFDPEAAAPPIPTMTATFLSRVAEGEQVRIEGEDLTPGRYAVVASGYLHPPTGMLAHLIGSAHAAVASVEVPADGRLSTTVTLPDALTDLSETTVDGVVQDPEVVACGVDTSVCDIWLVPDPGDRPAAEGGRGILTPVPTPYPEER